MNENIKLQSLYLNKLVDKSKKLSSGYSLLNKFNRLQNNEENIKLENAYNNKLFNNAIEIIKGYNLYLKYDRLLQMQEGGNNMNTIAPFEKSISGLNAVEESINTEQVNEYDNTLEKIDMLEVLLTKYKNNQLEIKNKITKNLEEIAKLNLQLNIKSVDDAEKINITNRINELEKINKSLSEEKEIIIQDNKIKTEELENLLKQQTDKMNDIINLVNQKFKSDIVAKYKNTLTKFTELYDKLKNKNIIVFEFISETKDNQVYNDYIYKYNSLKNDIINQENTTFINDIKDNLINKYRLLTDNSVIIETNESKIDTDAEIDNYNTELSSNLNNISDDDKKDNITKYMEKNKNQRIDDFKKYYKSITGTNLFKNLISTYTEIINLELEVRNNLENELLSVDK